MDVAPTARRFPLRRRVPPPIRRGAAWVCVVVFPFALVATVMIGARDPSWLPHLRYLLPLLVVALPAVLLRRLPMVGLGLMLVGVFIVSSSVHSWELGYPQDIRTMQFICVDVAVGYVAVRRPTRSSGWFAVLTLAVQLAAMVRNPLPGERTLANSVGLVVLAVVIAWLVGVLIRERAAHALVLREQAAAHAVAAERLRIARELHDMVAHSISVIAIQSGVGSRVMDSQPAEARRALDAIEATSRDTLTGLQHALRALRTGVPGSGPDSAPLDPTPGLHDMQRLAETVRGAGVHMEVRWLGDRRNVPPDVDLSAFRIIQEAVTNVVRHAGTRTCQVSIDYGDDELALEVCDDGGGAATHLGDGCGIVGMRERVGLLGGRIEVGPRPEGGFRVAARLPLPARPR